MRNFFPLFQSHLDLAHQYWRELLSSEDCAIDATCGNGHDALFLARCGPARIHAIDIQQAALEKTEALIRADLGEESLKKISFHQQCHSSFPNEIPAGSVALVVYNLGYLPHGDKTVTTMTSTTIQSLQAALELLQEGGVVSVTCYPGHLEGEREEAELLAFSAKLAPSLWSCCHHRWINRNSAPSLLLIQRKLRNSNE